MKKILTKVIISMMIKISSVSAMIDLNKYSTKIYKPVAMVDDMIVNEYDVNQKMKIFKMSGIEMSFNDCLNQVIDEIVIINTSIIKKIPTDLLNKTITQLAHDNNLSVNEFKALLNKFDVDIKALYKHMTAQLILRDMLYEKMQLLNTNNIAQKTYSKSLITQNEIQKNDALYSKPIIEYNFTKDSKVKIAEIIVKKTNNVQKIFDLLKNNTNFSEIKRKFPNDVELTGNDGMIGWVGFDELSSTYKEAIKNVRINHIAEPLVADDNLLFIKLLDVENAKTREKFLYSEYLKLTFEQKSKMLLSDIQLKLCADEFMSTLRKNFFIRLINM